MTEKLTESNRGWLERHADSPTVAKLLSIHDEQAAVIERVRAIVTGLHASRARVIAADVLAALTPAPAQCEPLKPAPGFDAEHSARIRESFRTNDQRPECYGRSHVPPAPAQAEPNNAELDWHQQYGGPPPSYAPAQAAEPDDDEYGIVWPEPVVRRVGIVVPEEELDRLRTAEARVAELELRLKNADDQETETQDWNAELQSERAALQSRVDEAVNILVYSEDLLPLTRIERALEVLREKD